MAPQRSQRRQRNQNQNHPAGYPGGLLRFIVFVPFGIYEGIARNHWNVIKSHDILRGGVFDSSIAKGEQLAAKWGAFGFYWSFAVWIPAIMIPPPFSLVFGLVDLALAIMLCLITQLQTAYSPHDVDRCKGSPGTHDWQRPLGSNESFFDAAARLNATATDSFHMCKSFVQEWQYGVTLSVFYCLIAAVNIILSVAMCVYAWREARRQRRSYSRELLKLTTEFPKWFVMIILAFIWYIPVLLFRCLPFGLKSRTRYARNYTVKTGRMLEDKAEMKMKRLKRKESTVKYKGGEEKDFTGLAEFLGIYDILILVVEELHYVDVLNLSLASKSVREVVLPAAAYSHRLNHFRMYTCGDIGKKQCWVCTNQICNDCKHSRALKQTTLYFHLDTCRPYCSKCFFDHIQNHPQGLRLDPPNCRCAPPTSTPNSIQRYINGLEYYTNRQYRHVPRSICRECDVLLDSELLVRREKRTKWELRDPRRVSMEKCRACSRALDGGPRWWVCKGCLKECTSFVHAPWGKKGKETEETVAEGDSAV